MTDYEVRFAPAAKRELKKLDRTAQRKIVKKLGELEKNPRPSGVEKLSQDPRFWRVKAGDYRVVYTIEDNSKIVVVVVVRHRKEAYRNLDQLDHRLVAKTIGKFLTGITGSAEHPTSGPVN